jgi:hypothetical protein
VNEQRFSIQKQMKRRLLIVYVGGTGVGGTGVGGTGVGGTGVGGTGVGGL